MKRAIRIGRAVLYLVLIAAMAVTAYAAPAGNAGGTQVGGGDSSNNSDVSPGPGGAQPLDATPETMMADVQPFVLLLPGMLRATGQLTEQPVVRTLWTVTEEIAVLLIAVFAMLGIATKAFSFWGYEVSVGEVLGRILVALVLVIASRYFAQWIIDINDALVQTFLARGTEALTAITQPSFGASIMRGILGIVSLLIYIVAVVALYGVLIIRVLDLALLTILAPLCMACYAMPDTAYVVRSWFTEFIGTVLGTCIMAIVAVLWGSAVGLAGGNLLGMNWFAGVVASVVLLYYLITRPAWAHRLIGGGSANTLTSLAGAGMRMAHAAKVAASFMV